MVSIALVTEAELVLRRDCFFFFWGGRGGERQTKCTRYVLYVDYILLSWAVLGPVVLWTVLVSWKYSYIQFELESNAVCLEYINRLYWIIPFGWENFFSWVKCIKLSTFKRQRRSIELRQQFLLCFLFLSSYVKPHFPLLSAFRVVGMCMCEFCDAVLNVKSFTNIGVPIVCLWISKNHILCHIFFFLSVFFFGDFFFFFCQ